MASIFKNSIIKRKLETLNVPDFEEKIEIVKKWHDYYYKGTLKQDKETSVEQTYNQDFFIKILGYEEKPSSPYSLEPKATTDKGQLPDLILGSFDESNKKVSAVVELKGASIPLDRPQKREGNHSPIQQAFKYKTQYTHCPFVIASNFGEFRLFQDNQLDYEIWTLDDLVNPDNDYFNLKKFYLLLNKDSFTAKDGKTATEELLSDIRIEEENISKKFYKEYGELRKELLRDIYSKNEVVRKKIDLGIEKAQKIIDRIVFVCFCEDQELLPENTLQRVLQTQEKSFGSLWGTLKAFFDAIDKGSEKLEIPDGYNGGLFKTDNDLDNLQIDDKILKKLANLGNYNFREDLSVNILGRIFEQSISDLEDIKVKVEVSRGVKDIDNIGKRKKDGIFYTPDYIVNYIIKNSLGKYLEDKEEELKEKHKLKEDILDENYEKREKLVYTEYQTFLQNIKVLDPACGSGAFLVKVFDFLLEENKRVGHILGGLFSTEDYLKSILKNNIFGVDLNRESVEITKLSLWLKTAEKGKKLTTLKQNIKCGNSLISDPEIAGDKAFDWNKEFPEIMENGGFDVIVGNPPYGAKLSKEAQDYLNKKYIQGASETAISFVKLSNDLLKTKGYLSFIIPKSFTFSSNYKSIREFILDDISEIVDCKKVWRDVKLEQVIFVQNKNNHTKTYTSSVLNGKVINNVGLIDKNTFGTFGFYLNGISESELSVGEKIHSAGLFLNDVSENKRGIILNKFEEKGCKKFIGGAEISRYLIRSIRGYKSEYFNVDTNGLIKNNSILIQGIVAHIENPNPHIMIVAYLPFGNDFYIVDNINQIIFNKTFNSKVGWSILNSKLINWYAYRFIYGKSIRTLRFDNPVTSRIPIPKISQKEQKSFIELADEMLELNKNFYEKKDTFLRRIRDNYKLEKVSKKLEKFYEINFSDFVSELKKKKVIIPISEQDELEKYFNQYKTELLKLQEEINTTDKEIDKMVYKLYGLEEEEIRIIERDFNNKK